MARYGEPTEVGWSHPSISRDGEPGLFEHLRSGQRWTSLLSTGSERSHCNRIDCEHNRARGWGLSSSVLTGEARSAALSDHSAD
jgi:hypothetical protein